MFRREFYNSKSKKFVGIAVFKATLIVLEGAYRRDDFERRFCSATYNFEATPAAAMKKATKLIEQHGRSGFEETEESKSYREFEHPGGANGKYWNIRILDEICIVNFGPIGKHPRYAHGGKWQIKYFDSVDDALRYYHRTIAKKVSDGYVEQNARHNQYSAPPDGLMKTRRPAKKRTGVES